MQDLTGWLYGRWVVAAGFMGGALLAIAPIFAVSASLPVTLIFLCLPVYMLHQVEEHAGDRFRTFVNQRMFGGAAALTREDVLVINIPGVWGVNVAALYAAAFGLPGFGLVAAYLLAINAFAHIVTSVRVRGYNPGLWTAVALFVPLAGAIIATCPATGLDHAVGAGLAFAIHALIIVNAARRVRGQHAEVATA